LCEHLRKKQREHSSRVVTRAPRRPELAMLKTSDTDAGG
jgi:hypothetical protein